MLCSCSTVPLLFVSQDLDDVGLKACEATLWTTKAAPVVRVLSAAMKICILNQTALKLFSSTLAPLHTASLAQYISM